MGTTKTKFFENEFLRVVVPDRWLAFLGIDSEGNTSPKKLHIFKDVSSEIEIFTHTGITVCYYEDASLGFLIKEFYDDIIDIPPFELGNYKKYSDNKVDRCIHSICLFFCKRSIVGI